VNSPVGTLASTDRVVDGSNADQDVMNATVNGYAAGAVQPTIIGIETVNVDGAYTTTGLDATNLIGAAALNLSAQIGAATATVDAATANASKVISAKANISTLNINTPAGGTGSELYVKAGDASTVSLVGLAGADLVKLDVAAGTTLTLDSGNTSTADTLTLNLSGGTNATTFTTANGWDTLNINSNTAANTITLGSANEIAAVATGNKVTIGGSQTLNIQGDLDAIAGALRTSGIAIEKASGAGVVTLTNNAALVAGETFFNRAKVDVIDLTTVIAAVTATVNEATTLKLSFDQTSGNNVTYNVDNDSATQMTANTGTLRLDVAATQTVKDIIIGAQVGTVLLSANTANVTITGLDTNASANTVETVAVSGNKNVTITAFKNDANDVLAANALTGNLTVGSMLAAGVVIGGSGSDSITVGANVAAVIRGGAGSDTIVGTAATGSRVTAYGDAGDDNITGGGIADLLEGGDGADLITAGAGADTVLGGAGSDTIVGGADADSMTGGAGDDIFQFAAAATGTPSGTVFETITDWAAGDRIDSTDGAIVLIANTTASSGVASISSSGLASFNSADNTLALRVTAVEAGINAGGTAAARQSAVFVFGSDSYLFISDGVDNVDANDVLIKLVGVNATTGITLNASGDISAIA
jgi:hypothetical protein